MNKTMKLMMAMAVCALATAADAAGTWERYFTDDAGKAWIPIGCRAFEIMPEKPDFWRSIVVKFPTPKGYEPFQEAH